MDLVHSMPDLIDLFYINSYQDLDEGMTENNTLTQLIQLIFGIMDPCLFMNGIGIEDLSISTDSIITRIPKIYYHGDDITNKLSPLVTNPKHHQLLYSITKSIITLIKYIPYDHSIDLYNLISSTLYISELIGISLSFQVNYHFIILMIFSQFIR